MMKGDWGACLPVAKVYTRGSYNCISYRAETLQLLLYYELVLILSCFGPKPHACAGRALWQ